MKMKIFAVALTILLTLSVVPAFSFEPPPPSQPKFVLYITPETKTFTGPCVESTLFDAQVCVFEVRNLYAWELCVVWDPHYLEIKGHTILVPPGWGTNYQVLLDTIDNASLPNWQRLHWIVTYVGAYPAGLGFNGSCPLATINFHVIYEPQYNNPGPIDTNIEFCGLYPPKLATGCTGVITPDEIHISMLHLVPSKPNMEVLFSKDPTKLDLTETVAQGYFKGQEIKAYLWVSNATKLWDINAHVTWNPLLLDIDLQQITINSNAFPMPWTALEQTLTPGSFTFEIARPGYDGQNWIKTPIKGTFWILEFDFKVKCSPGGDNVPVNATCLIDLPLGAGQNRLTMCENGKVYSTALDLDLSTAKYYWTPIPYDFSQDGHVGIEDITKIMTHYGAGAGQWDLNSDGIVDIYDVVQVSKKYCTSTPPHLVPW